MMAQYPYNRHTKVINGVEYEQWEGEHIWVPVQPCGAPYFCECGNDTFKVFSSAAYTTEVKCLKCGVTDIVHSG